MPSCGSPNRGLSARLECTRTARITKQTQLLKRIEQELKEKAVLFADMFPPQDSARGHSRNSADGKSRRSRGLCSERPLRQCSAVEWSR